MTHDVEHDNTFSSRWASLTRHQQEANALDAEADALAAWVAAIETERERLAALADELCVQAYGLRQRARGEKSGLSEQKNAQIGAR